MKEEKKRKAGRPYLPDGKHRVLHVRLSDKELAIITERARQMPNGTVSAYVRECLVGGGCADVWDKGQT